MTVAKDDEVTADAAARAAAEACVAFEKSPESIRSPASNRLSRSN